jgi:hypothetical protein
MPRIQRRVREAKRKTCAVSMSVKVKLQEAAEPQAFLLLVP